MPESMNACLRKVPEAVSSQCFHGDTRHDLYGLLRRGFKMDLNPRRSKGVTDKKHEHSSQCHLLDKKGTDTLGSRLSCSGHHQVKVTHSTTTYKCLDTYSRSRTKPAHDVEHEQWLAKQQIHSAKLSIYKHCECDKCIPFST